MFMCENWPDPSCHDSWVAVWVGFVLVVGPCLFHSVSHSLHVMSLHILALSTILFSFCFICCSGWFGWIAGADMLSCFVDISMSLHFDCCHQCAGWAWVFNRPACALTCPHSMTSLYFILISQYRVPWVGIGMGWVRPCWWYKYWSSPSFWCGCCWMNISLQDLEILIASMHGKWD